MDGLELDDKNTYFRKFDLGEYNIKIADSHFSFIACKMACLSMVCISIK